MSNKTSAIIVRATRDFLVGVRHDPAIRKGDQRAVQVDSSGTFWTVTNSDRAFGSCQVGRGWEIVSGKLPFTLRGWLSRLFV